MKTAKEYAKKEKAERNIPDFLKYKYRHVGDGTGWKADNFELPGDKIYHTVVAIMRANPPHSNHTAMLKDLCKKSVHLNIDIGSSNKFDHKNPFKAEERKDMLDLALKDSYDNYKLLFLPDFSDDEKWFNFLCKLNGPFSEIVSNNDYDLKIYKQHQSDKNEFAFGKPDRKYDILQPIDVTNEEDMQYVDGVWHDGMFIAARKPLYVSGTFVRAAMVNDWDWQNYVDGPVADYIRKNKLVDRIKEYCSNLKGRTLESLDDGR